MESLKPPANVIVKDTSGASVPDARIELSGPVRRIGATDPEGRFGFDGLPGGSYRVIVRREGFAVIERAVTLPIREPLQFTIEPSPVATYVQTVSKTAEPVLRTPFLVSIIAREEIEKTGANSLEDALRSVPGLQNGTQGNAYARIDPRTARHRRCPDRD